MKFRNIQAGNTFYFAPWASWARPNGPYVKLSARTYRDEPQRETIPFTSNGKRIGPRPIVHRVGSINVVVLD